MPKRWQVCAAIFLITVVAGCAVDGRGNASVQSGIDESGDTIVARTPATAADDELTVVREMSIDNADGAPQYEFSSISDLDVGRNGEIYVWDDKQHSLRMYDAHGKFVRQIGRRGGGPGEYGSINGIAVRGDGKLAVWDFGNGRINLYSPNGEYETSWTAKVGSTTRRPLFVDSASNTYLRADVLQDPTNPFGNAGFIKWDRDGTIRDSLTPPRLGSPNAAAVNVNTEGASISSTVPYHPELLWTMSPHGYFVAGYNDRYVVYALRQSEKPVRIEREMKPPPVSEEERNELRELGLFLMRAVDPDAKWAGAEIPDRKPAYRGLAVDTDGRIWVTVSQPSEKVPAACEMPPYPFNDPSMGAPPCTTWEEPTVYDVFAPTGQYLGHLRVPAQTTFYRMRDNHIWAATRDSLDVPSVTRFRIEPGLAKVER